MSYGYCVFAYLCVSCVWMLERKKDSCRRVKMQLPDRTTDQVFWSFWRIYDFESSLPGNKRNILFIRIYCSIRKCFRSIIFGGPCNFIENLITRTINNVKYFQNVQSFTWIGHAFVCAMYFGFKQIMQSIKWRLLITLITIKKFYILNV